MSKIRSESESSAQTSRRSSSPEKPHAV
jgi:hypothetical protein